MRAEVESAAGVLGIAAEAQGDAVDACAAGGESEVPVELSRGKAGKDVGDGFVIAVFTVFAVFAACREADAADEEFEYTYEGTVWGPVALKMETKAIMSVDEAVAEPVEMHVYSVDGVLVRSCVAETVEEAVNGLAQGLYIVNGQKVVVR